MTAGFTFAVISSEVRSLLEACERRELTEWETEFVASIRSRRRPPTDKQMQILRRIASGAPNYRAIADAAVHALPEILPRWLPDGKHLGKEYTALNPRRSDRKSGSFKVNTSTGEWSDFATNDRGGDVVSLAAFLFNLTQPEAARRVAAMLGLSVDEVSHG